MSFLDCCNCGMEYTKYISNETINYNEYFKIHRSKISFLLDNKNINKTVVKNEIKDILNNFELVFSNNKNVCICSCHDHNNDIL